MDSSGGTVLDKYNEQEQKLEEEVSKYIELNWREVNCQRNVGDTPGGITSTFSNGLCDFLFSVSGSTNAYIPALSYFTIDVELQVSNGAGGWRAPLLNDGVTLSNSVGDCLFNNCFFRMGGQDVSTCQSFIPQQGAIKSRIDNSGAWLKNIGRESAWIDSDVSRRLNLISVDGVYHEDGLIDATNYLPLPILTNAGIPHNGNTQFALAVNAAVGGYITTGTVTLSVGNGVWAFNGAQGTQVEVGDYITLPTTNVAAAAPQPVPTAYVIKITSIVSATVVNVSFPPGVIYLAQGAAVGGGAYRKKDSQAGRYNNRIVYQPPIGIFNSYQPLNASDMKLSLNPNPSYKIAAVQSIAANLVPNTNYILNVLNVRFFACQAKLAMPMNSVVDMPLNEIQVQNKNLTSVAAGSTNNLDFIVPPSTYAIGVFFQSNSAGSNTLLPPTTFSTPPAYGNFNVADLQSIQVNYGGVSKTSTLYTSAYNGSTNWAIQRWIQSIQYASNQNNPGGAEPFNSFIRSPYYFFDFSRDRMDSSSFVSVQAVFNSAQEQNTNMFIVAFYTRLVRSEYANGVLQQLTAVNA